MVWRLGFSRNIEEIDTHEDDEKAAYQGNGIDAASCVEALEQNRRGDDSGCSEENVVDGVHAVRRSVCGTTGGRQDLSNIKQSKENNLHIGRECIQSLIEIVL